MKKIISVSLGASTDDYDFESKFMGEKYSIKRIGADGSIDRAADLLMQWDGKADAFGLGSVKFPYQIGPQYLIERFNEQFQKLSKKMQATITTGNALRMVGHEWSIRHIQYKFGNNFFNNNRILFLSGMNSYSLAKILSEYTDNMTFADPIYENGIPKFLNSIKDLESFAGGIHNVLKWVPGKTLTGSNIPSKKWNDHIIKKAIQKAQIIVVPSFEFYKYVQGLTMEELGRKIIITSTAYDSRIDFLKERGVDSIMDTTPKILENVVGVNVLEAMMIAGLGKNRYDLTKDDLLEAISEMRMDPRVIYPGGEKKRVNRFAFVLHPLSQEQLKNDKAVSLISKLTPAKFMDTVEKVIAYAPPFVYSHVTGVKSPTGVEAEGWLITVGGTPKQMLSHSPEFTYKRLLQAARMAKRLGAQIMGLGAFTKVVGDAGVTVAKLAPLPITTGNSYSASGALWAASDAMKRMNLVEHVPGKKLKAKAMVIGATGAIGSVCARLLALAFKDVYCVDVRDARLLALRESIMEETDDVEVHIATRADKQIGDMDVIVTATSAAGKKILDITKVKPGCVITDVARPLDLSREDVEKRPDVLYIESGEILLPGNPEMGDIGLPPKVAYACLAETIVLALEGKFEIFTIGRDIEWEKVKEIFKLGLKHGMELAAISGVDGAYSDEDIQKVTQRAIEARKKLGIK